MRRSSVLLAPLLLTSLACPRTGPTNVPYPSTVADSTKPELWIQATTSTATHTLTANGEIPTKPLAPVSGGTLDMGHSVPQGDAGSIPDERSLIVSYR